MTNPFLVNCFITCPVIISFLYIIIIYFFGFRSCFITLPISLSAIFFISLHFSVVTEGMCIFKGISRCLKVLTAGILSLGVLQILPPFYVLSSTFSRLLLLLAGYVHISDLIFPLLSTMSTWCR